MKLELDLNQIEIDLVLQGLDKLCEQSGYGLWCSGIKRHIKEQVEKVSGIVLSV